MKTIQEISKLRKSLIDNPSDDNRQRKREAKEVDRLQFCLLYLESNPTEKFINKQLDGLKAKLKIIDESFITWCNNNAKEVDNVKNPKSKYRTVMGYKLIKQQISNLEFLLN